MEHDTQAEITRLIEWVRGMAAEHYANDNADDFFGVVVAGEDEYGDDSPVIGEAVWRGLQELLKPQNVYVQGADVGYLITIERA